MWLNITLVNDVLHHFDHRTHYLPTTSLLHSSSKSPTRMSNILQTFSFAIIHKSLQ